MSPGRFGGGWPLASAPALARGSRSCHSGWGAGLRVALGAASGRSLREAPQQLPNRPPSSFPRHRPHRLLAQSPRGSVTRPLSALRFASGRRWARWFSLRSNQRCCGQPLARLTATVAHRLPPGFASGFQKPRSQKRLSPAFRIFAFAQILKAGSPYLSAGAMSVHRLNSLRSNRYRGWRDARPSIKLTPFKQVSGLARCVERHGGAGSGSTLPSLCAPSRGS